MVKKYSPLKSVSNLTLCAMNEHFCSLRVVGNEFPCRFTTNSSYSVHDHLCGTGSKSNAAGLSLPVILFLHGSGERGTDGIRQTQVGIGPALAKVGHPSAVVVYPQIPNTYCIVVRSTGARCSNGSIKKDRRDIPHRPQ